VDGPPVMLEDPYAYVVAAFEAPPSPDYVSGPEYPPLPEFVSKPVYPEFMCNTPKIGSQQNKDPGAILHVYHCTSHERATFKCH
ncbi:hypothetical protein Tco_1340176, partial [Tanacetum coccineum]